MLIDVEIFTKPLVTIWQFFMADDKPQVIATIMRRDPDAGLMDGSDGVSYVVRMPGSTVQREVFVELIPPAKPDFEGAKFVAAHAEGNNFYKVRVDQRFSNEAVPLIVKAALFEHGRHPQAPVPAFLQGVVSEPATAADAKKKAGNLGERHDPGVSGGRLGGFTLN